MYLCAPECLNNDTDLTEIIFSYSQVQFWWQKYMFLALENRDYLVRY